MAITPEGAALTEAQRLAQVGLRAAALRDVVEIWAGLDPERLDASWGAVSRALMAVVADRREQSATVARAYYGGFRAAEGVPGPAPAVPLVADAEAALAGARVSLEVTGPATVRRLTAQHFPDPATVALVRVAGAVQRHVLDGGRDVLQRLSRADARALGYSRVTSGRACAFCAMLASRGAVYKRDTARFRSHDHCACTVEPLFRGGGLPPSAQRYGALWDEAKQVSAREGTDTAIAFRRLLEGAS